MGNEKSNTESVEHSLLRQGQKDLIGTTVLDKFEIIEKLGQGAFGTVYKAFDSILGRPVAVKVLHSHLIAEGNARNRFLQESMALATVDHQGIVKIYARGELESGQLFFIMDFVEGEELSSILERKGTLPADLFKEIFEQLLDTLSAAHHAGVIHRDLKPSNIMVCTSGETTSAMILDFGIAKFLSSEQNLARTATGSVTGSSAYMSPEQCAGAAVESRSDLYSLTCVMYECLSGIQPFAGGSEMETAYNRTHKTIEEFGGLSKIPAQYRHLIKKGLEREAKDRFVDAAEMKQWLQRCIPVKAVVSKKILVLISALGIASSIGIVVFFSASSPRNTARQADMHLSANLSKPSEDDEYIKTRLLRTNSAQDLNAYLVEHELNQEQKIKLAHAWMHKKEALGDSKNLTILASGAQSYAKFQDDLYTQFPQESSYRREAVWAFEFAHKYNSIEGVPATQRFDVLLDLGRLYILEREPQKAEACYKEALAFAQSKENWENKQFEANQKLARFYVISNSATAEPYARSAWRLCKEIGAGSESAVLLCEILRKNNKTHEAELVAADALQFYKSYKGESPINERNKSLLVVYSGSNATLKDMDDACSYYVRALAAPENDPARIDAVDKLKILTDVYDKKGLAVKSKKL